MSCPICDHTMQTLDFGIYWCSRCGTVTDMHSTPLCVPSIVERARALCGAVDATHYPSAMPMPVGVYARARNLRECCEVNATDPGEPIREEIDRLENDGVGR